MSFQWRLTLIPVKLEDRRGPFPYHFPDKPKQQITTLSADHSNVVLKKFNLRRHIKFQPHKSRAAEGQPKKLWNKMIFWNENHSGMKEMKPLKWFLKWNHSGLSHQMIGNVTGMASDKRHLRKLCQSVPGLCLATAPLYLALGGCRSSEYIPTATAGFPAPLDQQPALAQSAVMSSEIRAGTLTSPSLEGKRCNNLFYETN